MKNFFNKIFSSSKNLYSFKNNIKKLSITTPVKKIFEVINSHSSESEIRYVGGCLRKIFNNEKVDDIDLATNLNPIEVSEILKKNKINFYESGIEHGTITAILDDHKFEITSLREDIFTDGRHAKVKFSKDWKKDAARRDFTINSIYADLDGNIFDPHNGKKDIEMGQVNFIGDPEKRIKEDYLRILRYLRFFLNYSKQPHKQEIIKTIKINISGISIISKERLLDELKKILKSNQLEKLSKDKFSIELILLIFPELKNIKSVINSIKVKKEFFVELDFIFILFLMIIDGTDNLEYFLYKYNISKKDQKRAYAINNFYNEKEGIKTLNEANLNKVLYYNGRQAVLDILNFKIIKSKKLDKKMLSLLELYKNKITPSLPVGADLLMTRYKIPEGRQLGSMLKLIEEEWVRNNFEITEKQIDNIVKG
ncbi:CCA tRNA nucleotidyltransferase [Candidatus Pelagibacter sp. RS39]|uniref:CCA tRNA nucleotidyltransferase n=1 Tax=Candidatus Pelagibacter sp. RS39 TaxID=1977864 RepID=UPI000A15592C|nr:CCA tRNA nucleotidyltransferase [Candidatus Pelagibacter sp. RS39]ARJ48270.1 poly(A) polymerase [Candidatus Pelagibacter sp. RS39]